jgi:hypothetical protein
MRVLLVGALLASFVTAGFAADINDWSALRALAKGDRVGVIQMNQKRVEGRFDSATDTSITIQVDQPMTLEKSDVARVYLPAKHGRVFGLVLGGAIGVAAGGIVDGTLGQYLRNERGDPSAGVITAIGGAAGAGLGAAASGAYRTVYQRGK